MTTEKRFLVDVGIGDLPFPIRAQSRVEPEGQPTVADISISARIMQEFEARWIDTFIKIIHDHRDCIGPTTLCNNIVRYLTELKASQVRATFEFPFFMEKKTPKTDDKCLVRYRCAHSARISAVNETPQVRQRVEVPVITTYPMSKEDSPGGLFGQISVVTLEVETRADVYPEDLIELVDRHALVPLYSFLAEEDQHFVIDKIHSEVKSSVVMVDEIKAELARRQDIDWYSVQCQNHGMLHSYSTVIGTEKSMWVPMSGTEDEI